MKRSKANQRDLFNEPATAAAAADQQARKPAAMSREIVRPKADQAAGDGRSDRRQPAESPRRSRTSVKECGWCHHRYWWLSIYDVLVCANCHPPAHADLVVEWIGDPWPENGLKPNPTRPRPANRWPYVLG